MFFVRWIGNIAQNYQRSFGILMIGQVIFFVGLALFYLSADRFSGQPLLAEFMVLLAIILVAIGIAVALVGYLALTYGRWYHFFRKPIKKKTSTDTSEETEDHGFERDHEYNAQIQEQQVQAQQDLNKDS